jgi:FAD/FMN-containing dehydrogenase
VVRRLWPRRLRRSSFYWKLVALERKYGIADRFERLHRRPPLERVVQDVEIPLAGTADFLAWFLDTVPIEPLWLCPLRTRPRSGQGALRTWPLYPLEADRIYVNIGFWSVVPSRPGGAAGETNRLIEDRVTESDGHKSLYSDAFYPREDFDRLYGGTRYAELKETYDPEGRLLDLYAKAVGRR